MGARDLPFSERFDLATYVERCFDNVIRGPEDMHGYQHTAVDFLLTHPFSALFIDLGLGKTVSTLTAVMRIINDVDPSITWLVIAPVRVANETWPTEIGLWRHTAPLTYAHVRNEDLVDRINRSGKLTRDAIKRRLSDELMWSGVTGSQLKVKLAEALASDEVKREIASARLAESRKAVREHFKSRPATIHIINREQVEFLVDAWGADWPYQGVIIDESSCFKDYRSNRFKALRRVRPLMKRMIQLTATPCAETYEHLFAQIFLLDEGERFGRHITKFRERYFSYNKYSMKYKLRPGAEEEIAALIADITLTMKVEDYLDLAKPITVLDKVKLDREQIDLYKQMEDDFVVTLPTGDEVEAETAAALTQKLLQMASGVLYDTVMEDVGDGNFKKRRVVHHLHDSKIEKLREIVEESAGETVLVAYWHDSSLDRLKKAFPKAVVMDKEGKVVKPWNAKKIPLLLAHPQSAGHGLNLQHGGRRIVFFDIPWSLELYLQFIGRLARQGQTQLVLVHHLIAEGTLDEAVVEALTEKRDAQEVLFRILKRLRRKIINKEL